MIAIKNVKLKNEVSVLCTTEGFVFTETLTKVDHQKENVQFKIVKEAIGQRVIARSITKRIWSMAIHLLPSVRVMQ